MRIEPLDFRNFDASAVAQREPAGKTFLPGGRRRSEGPPPPPPTYTQEQYKAAERDAYKKGFLEGIDEGKKQQDSEAAANDRSLMAALETFSTCVAPLFKNYRTALTQAKQDVPKVALAIARKVAGNALEQNAQAAVEETATRCVEVMMSEPKLTITVHSSLAEALKQKLAAIASRNASAADLTVQADDAIAKTDCRVEWQGGGFTRDTGKLWQEVARVIESMSAAARHEATNEMDKLQAELPASDETVTGKKE